MAAIDYSVEKHVVHVAAQAPAERLRLYAAAQKKRLQHIPLAALSPVTLNKVRVLHVLAGHDKRAIAADYRRKSGEATSLKPQEIMDVNQQTVELTLRQYGVSRLIHGHTHRPADHRYELGGKTVERIVLSDWNNDRGEVLSSSNGELRREAVTA